MKVIIAGSRTLNHYPTIKNNILSAFNKWMAEDQENWEFYYRPEIVSGGAMGVDFCGELYAKDCGLNLKIFPAEWNKYGKSAGYIRNKQMAAYADALIAIWDGKSRGTKNMVEEMQKLNKLVYISNHGS